MKEFNIIAAVLGAMVLLLGLGSKRLAGGAFPPSLLALGLGVLLGPHVLGVLDLGAIADEVLVREKVARLTLGVALVAVALRIPKRFPFRGWRSLLALVGIGMPLSWAIGTGVVWLLLDIPFLLAALIAAIVTPTDPVAATPIVTGEIAEKHLPERLRHTISLESGANDGLAYLLVFLPFLLLTRPAGEALEHWLVHTLILDIGIAAVLGLVLGYGAGRLLELAEARDAIEEDWRLIYTVALSLLAIGAGRLMGSDEVLVAFLAGMAFVQAVTREDQEEEDRGQEAMNRFFSVPVFAVIGLTIPIDGWIQLGWRGPAIAAVLLLLRRPPVLLLLRPLLPQVRGWKEAAFVGWFGPIAVAAFYYAALMEHRLGEPLIWDVVSLVICASTLAHGTTAATLTRRMPEPDDR